MRQIILLILVFLSVTQNNSYAQMIATDFTVNDCSGTTHHLFAELDSGSIIVLCFVMPCSGCISPAKSVSNIVRGFNGSPKPVLMYLVDDDGNSSCSILGSWRNSHFLGLMPTFSDTAVIQTQYGIPGMPKIVVLGGTDHYVYDIENDFVDSAQLVNSINNAISGINPVPALGTKGINNIAQLRLFPNPAGEQLSVCYTLTSSSGVSIDIYNDCGALEKNIIQKNQLIGSHILNIDLRELRSGNYILKVVTDDFKETLKFHVAK